jgi:hypothetical protein
MGVFGAATMTRRWFNRWLGSAPLPRELFVHEDDWGQIEVLPTACAEWCEHELARIEAFSSAHTAPDGAGWTDIYMRRPAPAALCTLGVPFATATAAFAARLPAFDIVSSGSFSSPRPVPHVRGFGPAANAGIIVAPDSSADIADMVSLVLNASPDACADVLRAAKALTTLSPLILVDWHRGLLMQL